ncbi:MAG: MBL fold metallo-hydrolase [Candidatus Sumerlaeia bacterium]|nr:MBL fold metallo-hydrolase [Candidatus Sumerlaeia bacterium]
MRLTLLRHATLVVEFAGMRLLVDPMLGPARVALPRQAGEALAGLDGVWVSQVAADHCDGEALSWMPADVGVWGPEPVAGWLRSAGLERAQAITKFSTVGGAQLIPVPAAQRGGSAALVLRGRGEPTVLVAGDRPADPALVTALRHYRPDVVALSGGGAAGGAGFEATLTAECMIPLFKIVPEATFIVTHLEALGGGAESRAAAKAAFDAAGVLYQAAIPADGETVRLTA